MDALSRFIFFVLFGYFLAGCVVVGALYGAANYFFKDHAVDATCEMWQYEFRQCAGDRDCVNKIKGDRPEDCRPPKVTP